VATDLTARRLGPVPAWAAFLAAGAGMAVVFVLTGNLWVQAGLFVGVSLAATLTVAWVWLPSRRAHPDRLVDVLLLGMVAYTAATAGWFFFPLLVGRPLPPTSLVDALYFLAYGLFAVFLLMLGRRSTGADRRSALDAVIVALGLSPLGWVTLVEPLLADGRLSVGDLTYLTYPVAVTLLLALAVQIGFVAGRRGVPHLLLAGWIGGELIADVVYAGTGIAGTFAYGQAWQVLSVASYSCMGALALHPRTRQMRAPHPARLANARGRLLLLGAAQALPVLTLGYAIIANVSDRAVLFSSAVALLLILLTCLRLSGLMVDLVAQRRSQDELRQLADELAHQALHDPLTGLGNRALFAERAEYALSLRPTAAESGAAILLLDLDDFKTVNDTMGHEAGDRLLVEVASRLRRVTRPGEAVTRLGGDEFAVVMPQARLEDALRLADRLGGALAAPFQLGVSEVRPQASIGISIALRGQDRTTLLAEADVAMYAAKARGSGEASVFDPELHREVLARHQLEIDLRQAVSAGQLRLLYQPLVHLTSNEMVGVEALIRWEHPTRGMIPPLDFIDMAETNGTILPIGDWVLETACQQLLAWDEAKPSRSLRISVNVSPRQLADPEFVGRAALILDRSGVDPTRVTLEVTESALGTDTETMIVRLREFKVLGVSLAIDDFGTGYSSLSHLRRLPVDILKIDKSFVAGIAREPAEWALTTAVIRLAMSLGKTTLAEGIETGGQLAHLRSLHCEFGQGYLFGRPLTPDAVTALLDAQPGHAFLYGG